MTIRKTTITAVSIVAQKYSKNLNYSNPSALWALTVFEPDNSITK